MADFLDEVLSNEPAPAEPEVVTMPEPEAVEAATPEPQPEIPAEPVAEQPQGVPPGYVPIAAMMDERDKRRAVEAERDRLRAPVDAPTIPDPYDDPKGFADYQQQVVDNRITQVRFEMSDRFAKQAHGEDAVKQAVEWAQGRAEADPAFTMAYMREPDPIGWIVQQHKRDAMLSEIGNRSMDDFVRDYLAKNPGLATPSAPSAAPVPTVAATPTAPKPATPPRSIASDSSPLAPARSDNPMAAMDAIFTR